MVVSVRMALDYIYMYSNLYNVCMIHVKTDCHMCLKMCSGMGCLYVKPDCDMFAMLHISAPPYVFASLPMLHVDYVNQTVFKDGKGEGFKFMVYI